jgi:hypothetical protein
MAKLTPEDLRSRRMLDYRVLVAMDAQCDTIEVEAYTTAPDLRMRHNRIVDASAGHRALHYRVIYRIKTLIGPGQFSDETTIHVDTEVGNYPFDEPASWVLSKIPWSPHFKTGTVVCTGDHWQRSGKSLLGHLVRHHARLLNWDEVARGGGYVGWNGEAIEWHRKHYGDKPLTPDLAYPELPAEITHAVEQSDPNELFGGASRSGAVSSGAHADAELFAGMGRRSR